MELVACVCCVNSNQKKQTNRQWKPTFPPPFVSLLSNWNATPSSHPSLPQHPHRQVVCRHWIALPVPLHCRVRRKETSPLRLCRPFGYRPLLLQRHPHLMVFIPDPSEPRRFPFLVLHLQLMNAVGRKREMLRGIPRCLCPTPRLSEICCWR